jgi:hypothetical protein
MNAQSFEPEDLLHTENKGLGEVKNVQGHMCLSASYKPFSRVLALALL